LIVHDNAPIDGKLAQLGPRPIDSMARKPAGAFFKNFAGAVTRGRTPMHASE
jgi:carbon monoxide dehydrogenase subunit G